jgi:hypothetical protein
MRTANGRPTRKPIGAARWQGPLVLVIGLFLVVEAVGEGDQAGVDGLLRLVFGSMLLTGGAAALVPASGRTAVLGWALRLAQLFFILVALVVVAVWLRRR